MWMPVNLSGVLTDRYVYPFYCNVGYCDLYWIVVSMPQILFFFFFFFNEPPPPEFYPLPLHAPLPIPGSCRPSRSSHATACQETPRGGSSPPSSWGSASSAVASFARARTSTSSS